MKTEVNPTIAPPHAEPNSVESDLASVLAQEKTQIKPTLHASPKLGACLREVGGSLAFTAYQPTRLFMLSAGEGDQTNALERITSAAMGLALVERLVKTPTVPGVSP